jgi:alpha-L-rhamnosidase
VASSPELLDQNKGDLWDSGKVTSSQSAQVEYAGSALTSNATYYWKVRVWNQKGEVSPWSSVANWTTAFLSPEEWQARWICAPGQKARMSIDEAMYIWKIPEGGNPRRPPPGNCTLWRTFQLPDNAKVKDAVLYVAADESAVVKMNGKNYLQGSGLEPGENR